MVPGSANPTRGPPRGTQQLPSTDADRCMRRRRHCIGASRRDSIAGAGKQSASSRSLGSISSCRSLVVCADASGPFRHGLHDLGCGSASASGFASESYSSRRGGDRRGVAATRRCRCSRQLPQDCATVRVRGDPRGSHQTWLQTPSPNLLRDEAVPTEHAGATQPGAASEQVGRGNFIGHCARG